MKNWGDNANALNCYAEVKFIDERSTWACYVYALNPRDEDTIACIINGISLEVCQWSLQELHSTYNSYGENPIIDTEFRKIRASELFKKLSEIK